MEAHAAALETSPRKGLGSERLDFETFPSFCTSCNLLQHLQQCREPGFTWSWCLEEATFPVLPGSPRAAAVYPNPEQGCRMLPAVILDFPT